MSVGAVDVTDRCPVSLPVGTIDTPSGRSNFLLDIGIFRDFCSALRSDLQISHFSAPLGLPLEEPLECRKLFRDAFGVVQSINSNDKRTTAKAFDNALNEW